MPREDTQFKKGHSGRPKGSKNKVSKAYLQAINDDFQMHGKKAIETVRKEHPDAYLRLVAQLVPKDVVLEGDIRQFVINAQPELTLEQWQEQHGLPASTDQDPKLN